MRCAKRVIASQQGQVLVMFAAGLVAFCGLLGMSVDVGRLVYTRTDLQKAADAAALAGAQDLAQSYADTSAARAAANRYAALNAPGTSATVTFSSRSRANDVINVTIHRHLDTFFLRVVGLMSFDPVASASAYGGAAASVQSGGGMAVMPWAINNDAFTRYGVTVGLQPANAGGGAGSYNLVSINPPNGQSYADAVARGVTAAIVAGGRYPTNRFDGSKFSPATLNAMQARISSRPGETSGSFKQGSPRVVFVPVVDGGIPDPPTPVKILTFRAFFLERTDARHNVIYGEFVEANVPAGGVPAPGQTVPDLGVHIIALLK